MPHSGKVSPSCGLPRDFGCQFGGTVLYDRQRHAHDSDTQSCRSFLRAEFRHRRSAAFRSSDAREFGVLVVHHGRCESQRPGECGIQASRGNGLARGASAASDRRRAGWARPREPEIHRTGRFRRIDSESDARHRIQRPVDALRSGRRIGRDHPDPDAAHAFRTTTLLGRAYASCLLSRTQRSAPGTSIHRHSRSLLRRRARRLERRLGAKGQTGRYVAGSCRALPAGTPQLRRSSGCAVRRDIQSDAEGHRRQAHHHQSGRRRRGRLRRSGQSRTVRCHRHLPPYLRRHYVPQYRCGDARREEGACGCDES